MATHFGFEKRNQDGRWCSMTNPRLNVLVVGATGSIGSLVVAEALRQGHAVRALVRAPEKVRKLPREAKAMIGDVTRPDTLPSAVEGIDAVVFTLGSDGAGKVGAETVDYGGVRNVLRALGSRKARIALMTSIGVTNRTGSYNRSTEAHDWKRRSERLVRASGLSYTIVRPGWFDCNKPDEHRLVFLQGDTARQETPAMVLLRAVRLPRSLSTVSPRVTHSKRRSSWSRPPARHRTISMRCLRPSMPICKAPSTACATWTTNRWNANRSGFETIWMRYWHTDLSTDRAFSV